MKPCVDISGISVDVELIRQVPAGIAVYYEALPLAKEGNQVSVAMSHPDNVLAITVLGSFLKAEVVPIQANPATIRLALAHHYPDGATITPQLLCWHSCTGDKLDRARHEQQLAWLWSEPVTMLEADMVGVDDLVRASQTGHYHLTATNVANMDTLCTLLHKAATPLYLQNQAEPMLRRILVVLRGFASDAYMVDWVAPLVRKTGASVTLMPLTSARFVNLQTLLGTEGPVKAHISSCLQRFRDVDIHPYLKIRHDAAVQQISNELEQDKYDLLVIAAEGYGEFVCRVLADLQTRSIYHQQAVLVLKPIH
jgi:hypothetical protein